MNPPPQPPPHGTQVVVVQQKSGCGKAVLILGIIAGVCSLLVGGCFIAGMGACGRAMNEASKEVAKKEADRKAMMAGLEIVDFKWNKDGFGSVMEATFKIRNAGTADVKDIEIECTHFANSGTRIDSNSRTIYEIVKAGETREFKDFNMGFIHSQATKSVPEITHAVAITADPPKTSAP